MYSLLILRNHHQLGIMQTSLEHICKYFLKFKILDDFLLCIFKVHSIMLLRQTRRHMFIILLLWRPRQKDHMLKAALTTQ